MKQQPSWPATSWSDQRQPQKLGWFGGASCDFSTSAVVVIPARSSIVTELLNRTLDETAQKRALAWKAVARQRHARVTKDDFFTSSSSSKTAVSSTRRPYFSYYSFVLQHVSLSAVHQRHTALLTPSQAPERKEAAAVDGRQWRTEWRQHRHLSELY